MIYTRELTDDDMVALEHLVPDVKEWIDTVISEKIMACKKRIVRGFIDKAIDEGLLIPTSVPEIISAVVTAKDYKNQRQRDMPDTLPVDETPIAIDPMPADIGPIVPMPLEEPTNGQPA